MRPQQIIVTDYPKLKQAYIKAQKSGLPDITFKGKILTTVYAKYVLEYLRPIYIRKYGK